MKWWQIIVVAIALFAGFAYAVRTLEGEAETWAVLFWASIVVNVVLALLWFNAREGKK